MSALAHGHDPDVERALAIAGAATRAVLRIPDRRAAVYYDLILASLGEAARKALEMFPQDYVFQDPGMRRAHAEGESKGKAEGRAEGKAEAVLVVLESHGLRPTGEERAQILACTDDETLVRWLRTASTIDSIAALLGH